MERKWRGKLFDAVSSAALLALAAGLVLFPKELAAAAGEGLDLSFRSVIPALFPFFVLSGTAVRLGAADRLGDLLAPAMGPLFGVGGGCAPAFALGLLGGYPVGAGTLAELCASGRCGKEEAGRALAFCNNTGPAFILGAVGAGVFGSTRAGVLLYVSHVLSAAAAGAALRGRGAPAGRPAPSRAAPHRESLPSAFVGAVRSSFLSALNICGFVTFFAVLIRLLTLAGSALRISPDSAAAQRILAGALELSSGVWSLRGTAPGPGIMAAASFMLGWGGLSVHCQTLSICEEAGIPAKRHAPGKLLHGIFSAALTYLLCLIFPQAVPAAAAQPASAGDLFSAPWFDYSAAALCAALAIFAVVAASSKICGKRGKGAL